jgi:hypothetical protein
MTTYTIVNTDTGKAIACSTDRQNAIDAAANWIVNNLEPDEDPIPGLTLMTHDPSGVSEEPIVL